MGVEVEVEVWGRAKVKVVEVVEVVERGNAKERGKESGKESAKERAKERVKERGVGWCWGVAAV